MEYNKEVLQALLAEEFGGANERTYDGAQLMNLLKQRISQMLQGNGEAFFSMMYRLDIPEPALMEAIADKDRGIDRIAGLVYERQFRKWHSRKHNGGNTVNEEDADLEW